MKKSKKLPIPRNNAFRFIVKIVLLLAWVAAAVIVSQIVVGYLMLWMLGKETFSQTVPMAIYSALSYILALIWILFITPKVTAKFKIVGKTKGDRQHVDNNSQKGLQREELGLNGLPTWTDIGLAPIGFIVSTLAAAGLVAVFNMFPWFDASQIQEVGFGIYSVGTDRIIAFLILVLVAPVAEELVFRGWLYGKLRNMLNDVVSDKLSMILSILLVSVLFGAIHMQWNVGVNVFALSVVLCSLREITGTVYAGILTHMIKNGVAFFLIYVLGLR